MSEPPQLPPLPGPDAKSPEATPSTIPATVEAPDAPATSFATPDTDATPEADAAPPLPATFAELGVPEHLLRAIEKLEWTRPTEVQARAFPPGIAGKDLMVQSRTGSGKTGAFCLPWIASRYEPGDAKDTGVQLLVLLPTRELARQVCDQLVSLCLESEISVLPVYGGTAMSPQLEALDRGVHAVVGTPGRILDHIRRRSLVLDKVRTVVLDECDEMLSMGFLEDIRSILERCPRERQTCLFSATVPPDISRIARRSMRDPIRLELSTDGISAAEIQHVYYSTGGAIIKTRALQDVIMVEDPSSAIVFCNTREETRIVANVLRRDGYTAEALSSDLTQSAREHVMKLMRERKLRFLVATDVAARGIDISHVSHVINYSFPENAESYVHRTGRTGRAGRKGKAVSIVAAKEIGNFYMLTKQYADITFEEQQLPDGDEIGARRRQTRIDAITHQFSELVSPEWTVLARDLMSDPRGEQVMALLLSDAMAKNASRNAEAAPSEDDNAAREEHQARRARRDSSGRGRVRRRDRDAEDHDARPPRSRRPSAANDDEVAPTDVGASVDPVPSAPAAFTDDNTAATDDAAPPRRRRRRRRGARTGEDAAQAEGSADATPPVTAEAGAFAEGSSAESVAAKAADAPTVTDAPTDEGSPADDGSPADATTESATDAAETADEGAPKRRRRRRRRRGGAKNTEGSEARGDEGESEGSADETAPSTGDDASDGAAATSEDDDKPKKRRRRRRRRGGKSDEPAATGPNGAPPAMVDGGQTPTERLGQGDIVIEIEDDELEVVREHFGEVDELGELTLRGMRRDVIDNLREEAVIEDLSEEDNEEEDDLEDASAEASDGEGSSDVPGASPAPAAPEEKTTDDGSDKASATAPSTAPGDAQAPPDAEASAPKKKRRRRRKKKAPFVPPELTAPPHKDFWEVWSGKFTSEDFNDEKFPLPEIPETPPPAPSTRPSFESAPKEDEGEYVRVALSLGRKQGYKSAGIRGFLAEHAGLKGRSVRDLTVRTNTSYFRISEAKVEETIAMVAKSKLDDHEVELRRTSETTAPPLRAEVPAGLEDDVVADLKSDAPTRTEEASKESASPEAAPASEATTPREDTETPASVAAESSSEAESSDKVQPLVVQEESQAPEDPIEADGPATVSDPEDQP